MQTESALRLAVWTDRSLDDLAIRLAEEGALVGVTVERWDRWECQRRLSSGLADVALVATVGVLSEADDFDVYPDVAISSWCSDTARILLRNGLAGKAETVACDVRYGQEAFLARIVLREHYGLSPAFLPIEQASAQRLLDSHADAVLFAGEDIPRGVARGEPAVELDLGQEWFEYTGYPMVWGLFVSRRGESEVRVLRLLRSAAADLAVRLQEIEDLVQDASIRYELDDLALAGLTEMADIVFFYQVTEEVPILQFATDPDDEPDPREDDGYLSE